MTDERETGATQTPENRDLAGEYALGLLAGAERSQFEATLNENAALREEVARWQEHFAALGMDVEEVTPPASVLSNLKRELWNENRLPWQRRIRIWEYALGGVAAALVAFAVYTYSGQNAPGATVMHASISNTQSELQIALALSVGSGLLRIERVGPEPHNGRDYELWAIAEGAAPVSLGVLPKARVTALKLDETHARLVRVGVTLALSDEPAGGSPTGAPSGAVLGAGAVQVLTNL
ncbi:MAG: anti-sigma factor [Planktotalea sp.]|uniref:anti-sigma factor n=1 Tax=Planktotalea sp. TaxID=2029877 RepID=UPI003C72F471